MPPEIAELHAAFNRLVGEHADEIAAYFDPQGAAMAEIRASGSIFRGDRLSIPPAVFPRSTRADLARRHVCLRRALQAVVERRFLGRWEALADVLGLSPEDRKLIAPDARPMWRGLARPDVVATEEGLTMVEPNLGSSIGGMAEADMLGRLCERAPYIGDLLARCAARRADVMAAVAGAIRRELCHADEDPGGLVVVAEYDEELRDPSSCLRFEGFATELRRHSLTTLCAPVEDLEVSDGVWYRGRRCSAILRKFARPRVPSAELAEQARAIVEAAGRREVVLVDDLGDQMLGDKTVLALVSEELASGNLPATVAGALTGFVPWTRILEPGAFTDGDGQPADLFEWCTRRQEWLVAKPGRGFSGRGVTIGREVTAADWHAILDEAAASPEPWIVQRLVESKAAPLSVWCDGELAWTDVHVDYGYFAVMGDVPGMLRRNAPVGTSTRKVKQAGFAPVFFV